MDFLRVFKALGDETRLRLVNLFAQSRERICVCELTDALLVPQYQVSRHLTVLKNVGLVGSEREGTWIYYRLLEDTTECSKDLIKVIRKHFKGKYKDDIERLNQRLAKREGGKCVIGFALSENSYEGKQK